MKHILISVGCNSYEYAPELRGAENDAKRIFSLLTDAKFGFCDPTDSALILSPSLAELQTALMAATKVMRSEDVLTFYFAGHGHVKGGIFYFCCRDTVVDRVGMSALPLNNLLSLVHEISPRHANLVIDACNSGGVMGDFNRALSPDTIGSTATTGITLLAACAQDQSAAETDEGGVCTTVIARCIDGTSFVQDLEPALDLTSISTEVSRALQESDQRPTYWGLNLTGRPNFCVNPHFSGDGELRRALAEAGPMTMPPRTAKSIQKIHDELDKRWAAIHLQHVLLDALSRSDDANGQLVFLHRLARALRQRAAQADDPFREVEVAITCLAPLLEKCREHPITEQYLVAQCAELGKIVTRKCEELHLELLHDDYALVGETGIGELFVIPKRITFVLGWMAWAILVSRHTGGDSSFGEQLAKRLLATILDKYQGSIRSISDEQAPGLLVLASALRNSEAREDLEQLVGLYFLDLCESRGLVAHVNLEPSLIVSFLLAKSQKNASALEMIANPSTFLLTLLVLARELDLGEEFDLGMEDIDHRNANAFIPETYCHFARERIEDGYNATFQIGEGIWRVADFTEKWDELDRPSAESIGVLLMSAACSLVHPDRVAWHLFERECGNE